MPDLDYLGTSSLTHTWILDENRNIIGSRNNAGYETFYSNSSKNLFFDVTTRDSVAKDSGLDGANNTTTNHTYTVVANTILSSITLQQLSTGTITVAAGAGVTLIPPTPTPTSTAGQILTVIATPIPNTYIVKLSS